MNDKFIIPLNGLTAGENHFFWQAGKEFFDSFENSEILDAHLDTDVRVEKSGRYIGVDCDVRGEIKVECDRCLDELELPVDVEIMLSVKYGDEESSDEPQEGEREVLFVPEDSAELVHEDGECNPDTMKYYGVEVTGISEENEGENPFSALKSLFK